MRREEQKASCNVAEHRRKNQRHLTMLTKNLLLSTANVIEFQTFKNILTHTLWMWNETFAHEEAKDLLGSLRRFCLVSDNLLSFENILWMFCFISNFLTSPIKLRHIFSSRKVNKQNFRMYINVSRGKGEKGKAEKIQEIECYWWISTLSHRLFIKAHIKQIPNFHHHHLKTSVLH